MNKVLVRLFLAGLVGASLITASAVSFARTKDNPNSGFCKSGKHVKNMKNCKENGGRK